MRNKKKIETGKKAERNPFHERARFHKSLFGDMLYKHFGEVRDRSQPDKETTKRLFSLHNAVRAFYQKIGKTHRLRLAMKADAKDDLSRIVPKDTETLFKAIGAKSQNAKISELIRLGKLIVHASDILDPGSGIDDKFKMRMDYFATSDGQCEIKRNETFTRVWRNSVGLSIRSLKALIDDRYVSATWQPKDGKIIYVNDDIMLKNVSASAAENLKQDDYKTHISLLFGNKSVDQLDGKSRASIFNSDTQSENQEHLWSLLRLAAEIRNRTNHFCTKQRLARLITSGVLQPLSESDKHVFADRHQNKADQCSFDAFEQLLDFDEQLRKVTIVDDLNRLGVGAYLDEPQVRQLCGELAKLKEADGVTVPKFMSVLQKIRALSENKDVAVHSDLKPFTDLDLKNLSTATKGLNHCQVGILRHLYTSGFKAWLAAEEKNAPEFSKIIETVIASRKGRSITFQKQKNKQYQYFETWLDQLSAEDKSDATSLSKALAAYSTNDGKTVRNYRAVRGEQSKRSGWVEDVRQELFAHLFADYLTKHELGWIWELTEAEEENETTTAIDPIDIKIAKLDRQPWHRQFYAWLYLIPSDDISLLRHQFRKTSALETKSVAETDPELAQTLDQMDQLMALYTKVQSAGFDGTEHVGDKRLINVLYKDENLFKKVYSDDFENHHITVPGTRRGLRQILRYGHYNVLESIFKKHPVIQDEIDAFLNMEKEETKALFKERDQLHKEIIELSGKNDADKDALQQRCKHYREKAVEAASYNFLIAGARLTDHAKLHHLMMHIVGRLTDYTLMWERDRIYIFLGMLYQELHQNNQELNIEFDRQDGTAKELRIVLEQQTDERGPLPGFVRLWTIEDGFAKNDFEKLKRLLNGQNRELFDQYFVGRETEHQKDIEAREKVLKEHEEKKKGGKQKKHDKPKTRDPLYLLGKQQIRDDFAHYSVIGKKWHYCKENGDWVIKQQKTNQINLTFLVNSVRGLLAYDRKLKNAVSQSITHILEDEGLSIEWKMQGERLKNAMVTPLVQPHLTMLRRDDRENLGFALPRASVRYTSMVQALFDFGNGGYRQKIETQKGEKSEGRLEYPVFETGELSHQIPNRIRFQFPELGSENEQTIEFYVEKIRKKVQA